MLFVLEHHFNLENIFSDSFIKKLLREKAGCAGSLRQESITMNAWNMNLAFDKPYYMSMVSNHEDGCELDYWGAILTGGRKLLNQTKSRMTDVRKFAFSLVPRWIFRKFITGRTFFIIKSISQTNNHQWKIQKLFYLSFLIFTSLYSQKQFAFFGSYNWDKGSGSGLCLWTWYGDRKTHQSCFIFRCYQSRYIMFLMTGNYVYASSDAKTPNCEQ